MFAKCHAGGGSHGIVSFGYEKALKELGIVPDVVYSSSVGTLNSLMILQDQVDDLEEIWMTIRSRDVYTPRIGSIWKLLTSEASLNDSKPLEKLLRKCINMKKLRSAGIPFIVSVTNLTHLRPEYQDVTKLDEESAVSWMLASASPPILFPAIEHPLGNLADAGVCTNFNVMKAVEDGANKVLALIPTHPKETVKTDNLVDIIESTISAAISNYLPRELSAVEAINKDASDKRNIDLTVIYPEHEWGQGVIDFDYEESRAGLIKSGYDLAMRILKSK